MKPRRRVIEARFQDPTTWLSTVWQALDKLPPKELNNEVKQAMEWIESALGVKLEKGVATRIVKKKAKSKRLGVRSNGRTSNSKPATGSTLPLH